MATDDPSSGRSCCIPHLFHAAASRHPNKVAIVHAVGGAPAARSFRENTPDDACFDEEAFLSALRISQFPPIYPEDESFTYGEVLAAVEQLSCRLRAILDGGHDPALIRPSGTCTVSNSERTECSMPHVSNNSPRLVGLCIYPSVYYIVAVLATLRIGEAFLPIDTSWPKQRILSIISFSKPTLIINCRPPLNSSNRETGMPEWLISGSNCHVLILSDMHIKGQRDNLSVSDIAWPCQRENPSLFSYVLFTSGSTGRPKGVCGTEKGLVNRFLWMQTLFPVHLNDVWLFKTSISFIDHLQEFLGAILSSSLLVIPTLKMPNTDHSYVVEDLEAYSVTRLTAVPSLIKAILPLLSNPRVTLLKKCLQVLILSGELFSLSLWYALKDLLPNTAILNLYGSTEVSGDCTFFDCKRLPEILETEVLISVPIGSPIPGCKVLLTRDPISPNEGEICVGGTCISSGYLFDSTNTTLDFVKLKSVNEIHHGVLCDLNMEDVYFKTGDFAKQLENGAYVFVGRKDRVTKIRGLRISLEEVENNLSGHPYVSEAAVTLSSRGKEHSHLVAHIILKEMDQFKSKVSRNFDDSTQSSVGGLVLSFKSWLAERLPPGMIPSEFLFLEKFPLTSSGKIDYSLLSKSTLGKKRQRIEHGYYLQSDWLQIVREAFCEALMIKEVQDHDDFFSLGGNSMSAAYLGHILDIDMRLIYMFPSPSKVVQVMLGRNILPRDLSGFTVPSEDTKLSTPLGELALPESEPAIYGKKVPDLVFKNDAVKLEPFGIKGSANLANSDFFSEEMVEGKPLIGDSAWLSKFHLPTSVSFSRCNRCTFSGEPELRPTGEASLAVEIHRENGLKMQTLWKVNLKSCVDASPLVVSLQGKVYLFIGAHSHMFMCIEPLSGQVLWNANLEGRVECSAAITDDFFQVIVGCYRGKVYFLEFMTGIVSWAFRTGGEVKSQPVVDKSRHIAWCGSYDHNLYALDYKNQCCISKIFCGGSIYGSPYVDTLHELLYVGSTSGRIMAVSLQGAFAIKWQHELGVPVFGSASINSENGNVIFCLVDGNVICLDSTGAIIWRATTGGPIFAGGCISSLLHSQVLICSRDGLVYSFDLESGELIWKYQIGSPITSSSYVDEGIILFSGSHEKPYRLLCVCSCSGSVHVLGVHPNPVSEKHQSGGCSQSPVFKFADMDLPGDIFSSPVMIGGRIFVGCRDDHVYCLTLTDLGR